MGFDGECHPYGDQLEVGDRRENSEVYGESKLGSSHGNVSSSIDSDMLYALQQDVRNLKSGSLSQLNPSNNRVPSLDLNKLVENFQEMVQNQ